MKIISIRKECFSFVHFRFIRVNYRRKSVNMVLEHFTAFLLDKFLGDYIEDIDSHQLKIHLWSGMKSHLVVFLLLLFLSSRRYYSRKCSIEKQSTCTTNIFIQLISLLLFLLEKFKSSDGNGHRSSGYDQSERFVQFDMFVNVCR